MKKNMITISNIKKSFGHNQVLKGIDLNVSKGEVVVIIGPSGSGKTTLLRCLNYLEKPDEAASPSVIFPSTASTRAKKISISFVESRLWCFSSTIYSSIRARWRM